MAYLIAPSIAGWHIASYAPELNPDELLKHDVKRGMSKSRPTNRQVMKAALRTHLHCGQKQPEVVFNFFKAEQDRAAS